MKASLRVVGVSGTGNSGKSHVLRWVIELLKARAAGKPDPTSVSMQPYDTQHHAHYDATNAKTILEIRDKSGKVTTSLQFNDYPEEKDVVSRAEVVKLSSERRTLLLEVYRQVNPLLIGSLLVDDEEKNIMCGSFKMTSEAETLAVGLIEILYSLRNALFHGLIDPNKDANRVYEAAYQIMHTLIISLA